MWAVLGMASGVEEKFIDSFCDVRLIPDIFKGQLGKFTPCFVDVVVLGSAHIVAFFLLVARLAQLRRGSSLKYRLTGSARLAHSAAALLAAACLLVVAFQLNARLASDATPLISGKAAPFEWAGYSLALLSWSLFLAVFLVERNAYLPTSTWLWRFPVFLIFAGELAKAKFVVELSEGAEHSYFYYLFMVYVGLQGALAALAAFYYPASEQLDPVDALGLLQNGIGYQALPGSRPAAGSSPDEETCPEASAGLVSHLLFSWVGPLLVKGYRAPLRFEDVWKLPPGDRVDALGSNFQREWGKELAEGGKRQPSLVAACWRCTRGLFLGAIPWKLTADAAAFVGPSFLNLLLGVVSEPGSSGSRRGYAYAAAMLAGLLVGVVADNQQFQRVMRSGFQLRSMLTHAVLRKLLFMSPTARAQFTSGRLYSAVGSDVDSIQQLCMSLLGLISAPIRIVGALVLLHAQLGAAAWVTLGVLAALMPVQATMVRLAGRVTKRSMKHTDERSKLEGELVGGIDVVKCYAWEESFLSRVLSVRTEELQALWQAGIISSVNTTIMLTVPVLAALGSFGAYSLLSSEPLTAAQAFTSLTLLGILQLPLFQLPMLLGQLVSARVAIGRLQQLLASEEQPALPLLPPASPGEAGVRVEGEFSWDADSPPALVDVKLRVPAGALVAAVGPTGSGKSSLLSAALGLMYQVAGPPPQLRGGTAYVPQAAFIVNDTVRGNILFGADFEEGRYWRAVDAACLDQDLKQLPAGDQTELGERGVNVSGGQKQRIALARAVYSRADVLLLDDPLSALDAKVGRRVFRQCIMGALASKTRLLVTNQLQYAKAADLVAFMQDGQIQELGTYDELLRMGGGFAAAMSQAQADEEATDAESSEEDNDPGEGKGGPKGVASGGGPAASGAAAGAAATAAAATGAGAGGSGRVGGVPPEQLPAPALEGAGASPAAGQLPAATAGSGGPTALNVNPQGAPAATTLQPTSAPGSAGAPGRTGHGAAPTAGPAAGTTPGAAAGSTAGRLTTEETRSQGAVSTAVIWAYVAAMGGPVAAVLLMLGLAAVEVGRVGSRLWLQQWTTDVDTAGGTAPHPAMWYLAVYAAISGGQILFTLVSQFYWRGRSLAAADSLHAGMLRRLLRAPMAFFNTTPLGRIVNRLTKDTADIDRTLPDFTVFYLRSLLQMSSTLALVAALNPFTLWALTPCMLGFYLLYQYFQATVREVKRLDAISRSPLYGCVGDAISGLATIRAYRGEGRLVGRCEELLDRNIAMSLVSQSANRWLSIRLEGLGACAAFAAAVLAVEQRGAAAVLGNILAAALNLTPLVSMTVRSASLAELSFNAAERVEEYCKVPQEGATFVPGSVPPGWPDKGEIKFEAVRMRYRPGLPLVLKGLTCTIPAGSSCGVVGRTGAGKSSLINALFRLVEVEGGRVLLDGVNTSRAGLRQVRGAMALIPQAPVLFTGTIRFNLSPFGQHGDSELWGALRRAHLAPAIQASSLGLDMVITEGGAPLSAGQKQLLALARALLRHSRVLVLDEATANVDLETDALIQKTVRSEFEGCTVVAIAHRLHTVIDADSVLVMEAGRAAEMGTPSELLSKRDGLFTDMVRETGEATERLLRQLAAGEAQARSVLSDAAQSALDRLASVQQLDSPGSACERVPAGECAYRLSKEVEGAAGTAAAAVRAALQALQEIGDEAEGEDVPTSGAASAAAAATALRHAFQLVEQVRQLAQQAQRQAPRPLGFPPAVSPIMRSGQSTPGGPFGSVAAAAQRAWRGGSLSPRGWPPAQGGGARGGAGTGADTAGTLSPTTSAPQEASNAQRSSGPHADLLGRSLSWAGASSSRNPPGGGAGAEEERAPLLRRLSYRQGLDLGGSPGAAPDGRGGGWGGRVRNAMLKGLARPSEGGSRRLLLLRGEDPSITCDPGL